MARKGGRARVLDDRGKVGTGRECERRLAKTPRAREAGTRDEPLALTVEKRQPCKGGAGSFTRAARKGFERGFGSATVENAIRAQPPDALGIGHRDGKVVILQVRCWLLLLPP